jgi:hypothetical protein
MTTPPEPPDQVPGDQPPTDAAPGLEQTPLPSTPTDPIPPASPTQPLNAPKQGMSGCLKAGLIIGGILVVLGIVVVALVFNRVRTFVEDVGGTDGVIGAEEECSFVSDRDASQVLGTSVTGQSGDSLVGAILGLIRDTRLLPDAPSCFISNEESDIQVWISIHDGSDAAEVFAQSREIASGQVVSQTSTEDGSLVVETSPFIGSNVGDLGDEAFCVQAAAIPFGGVLARRGDRVVFVSMLAGTGGDGSDVLGDTMCERAQPLARRLLE